MEDVVLNWKDSSGLILLFVLLINTGFSSCKMFSSTWIKKAFRHASRLTDGCRDLGLTSRYDLNCNIAYLSKQQVGIDCACPKNNGLSMTNSMTLLRAFYPLWVPKLLLLIVVGESLSLQKRKLFAKQPKPEESDWTASRLDNRCMYTYHLPTSCYW